MKRVTLALLLLAKVPTARKVAVEYGLAPSTAPIASVQWNPLVTLPLDTDSIEKGHYPLDFSEGKVHGSVPGDGQKLADEIWDAHNSGSWVGFRIADSAIVALDLANFRSSYHLAKGLSNMEFGVVTDQNGRFQTASLSVPWDEKLESSSRRLGSLTVHKPVFSTSPMERENIPDIYDDSEKNPDQGKRPPPQTFMGKYWWAILIGFLIMQMFNQPETPSSQGQQQQGQQQGQQVSRGQQQPR